MTKILLDAKSDLEVKNIFGESALLLACAYGYFAVAQYLLAMQANINSQSSHGATALLYAVEENHLNVVNLLIENKADVTLALHTKLGYHDDFGVGLGDTPLHAAVKFQNVPMIESLLTADASIETKNQEGKSSLDLALEHKDPSIANLLRPEKIYTLDEALSKNKIPTAIELLENIDYKTDKISSILDLAVAKGDTRFFMALVRKIGDQAIIPYQEKTTFAAVKNRDPYLWNILRLLDYIARVCQRADQHYKYSIKFFCWTILNLGFNAKQKKDAALALKHFIFNRNSDEQNVLKHKKVLENGELKEIYRSFNLT